MTLGGHRVNSSKVLPGERQRQAQDGYVTRHEREMLMAWRDFVEEVDPDVVIGYNISNFDFPYLMDRAEALKLSDFPFLGRLKSKS